MTVGGCQVAYRFKASPISSCTEPMEVVGSGNLLNAFNFYSKPKSDLIAKHPFARRLNVGWGQSIRTPISINN